MAWIYGQIDAISPSTKLDLNDISWFLKVLVGFMALVWSRMFSSRMWNITWHKCFMSFIVFKFMNDRFL